MENRLRSPFNTSPDTAVTMNGDPASALTTAAPENALASRLIVDTVTSYTQPTHASVRPDASIQPPPLNAHAPDLTNFAGTKFTRGWLSGYGGAELDALTSIAMPIKPMPYNNALADDFIASRGDMYRERLYPSWQNPRVWGPLENFGQAFAPDNTWTLGVKGQADPLSGMPERPTIFSGLDAITAAPISQYYARGQVCTGGDGLPSVTETYRRGKGK